MSRKGTHGCNGNQSERVSIGCELCGDNKSWRLNSILVQASVACQRLWNTSPWVLIKRSMLCYVSVTHAESWTVRQSQLPYLPRQVERQTSYWSDMDIHREGAAANATLISTSLGVFLIRLHHHYGNDSHMCDDTWFQHLWRLFAASVVYVVVRAGGRGLLYTDYFNDILVWVRKTWKHVVTPIVSIRQHQLNSSHELNKNEIMDSFVFHPGCINQNHQG